MSAFLLDLQHANQRLERLLKGHNRPDVYRTESRQEDLAAVLSEILQVGEWLARHEFPAGDPELARELSHYRIHLEQMRDLMPVLHAELLTERARLEAERSHLESASAWAEASKSLAIDHFK